MGTTSLGLMLSRLAQITVFLAFTGPAWAEQTAKPEPAADRSSITNPFASRLNPHPGRLVVNLQAASLHNQGLGLAVGYVPWGFLEVKLSYAYWYEHSVAGYLKLNILPRAVLTPYIPVGYALGIANMRGGLRLYSHQLFAGAGLQARVLSRFFVAGEITANVIIQHTLKDKEEVYSVTPSHPLAICAGFLVGVYLL